MNLAEFNRNVRIVSKEYRAVCDSNSRHYKGKWHLNYSDASKDVDSHRKGKGEFHEIWIEQRIKSRALVK